ncbi:uncharacterized protein MELLADRAFT_115462 [Melampsora larici-populina 98AG31]|uniref:Arginyl-tRNA--protein transferase 1 n=1 Tax=Melampsora larici-populina (strain 98AG31 / pathotype 3-4-7) TaxID=747676 RepID=F4RAT3_MELLP|nr:uncharacterized protein MELLADRAFT_115462 [Melampsora larici-populina 98AG31]EGG10531.1 hypothetical protein MELLADRAFT_115462 [Melampsora larici-populina 98AG31]
MNSTSTSPEFEMEIEPSGFSKSKCGYCHSTSPTSHQFGFWGHGLSPQYYQKLLNAGWRRSGSYLYLPYHPSTCCPPYPIRCSAKSFKPTKSQRQTLKRWKNFLIGPTSVEQAGSSSSSSNKPFDLIDLFNQAESNPKNPDSHDFKIKLEPAAFSEEKYNLYQRYQVEIHHDPPTKTTRSSFHSFLCESPFSLIPIPSSNNLPPVPGAYHASYYLDEKLIGLSVLDILPEGISSVYFIWEPTLSSLSLGKVSALRELAWIQSWFQSNEKLPKFEYYFLGFYIHSCTKMKYKAEYQPSELLNPLTKQWHFFHSCLPKPEETDHPIFEDTDPTIQQERQFDTQAMLYFNSPSTTPYLFLKMDIDTLIELTKVALGEELSKEVEWITQFDVIQ